MTIKELYEQVCEKKNVQLKLDELYNQKAHLEDKIVQLKLQYEKEQKDVAKLENGSLSMLFYNLTGKLEEKLDREKQEELHAKANYDTAVYQLGAVNNDIARYQNRLKNLADCEEKYDAAVKEKLAQLKNENPEIIGLEQRLAQSAQHIKEIKEAAYVGDMVLQQAVKVKQELDSADGWATFDMFGGGLIADAVKYSHIDTAQQLINDMQLQLGRFKTELADVEINTDINIDIGEFLKTADYLFDNFFTDFAVMDKIANAKNQVENTVDTVAKVVLKLEQLLQQETATEQQLKKELEAIAAESNT